MLRFDLDNETETIRNYRQRVLQAEALVTYALSEKIRMIISPGAGTSARSGNRTASQSQM